MTAPRPVRRRLSRDFPRPARPCGLIGGLFLLAAGALAVGVPAAAGPRAVADGPFDLTLFHTNDIHAGFAARPHEGRPDAPVGGFAALAGHLARERTTAARWLLVDGGDFMTGNPVCELPVAGVRGGALAALMNVVGYHAGVIGNHEFDGGRRNLELLAEMTAFPLLAADLVDRDGDDGRPVPGARQPAVLERDGLLVGVLGVTHHDLEGLLTAGRLDGLTSRDQLGVLRRQLADLTPRTDVQVLLSHNGLAADRRLAGALAPDGLDVIVGGHSHTRLAEPEVVDGVLIVQAGSGLRHLGRLDLRLADGRVTHHRGRLILLTADAESEAPEIVRGMVDHFDQQVAAVYGRRIGRLDHDLRRDGRRESALGSWLCDVLREHAAADVAVVNSGGIRKDLRRGILTELDVHEALPFGNTLVVHEVPGAGLRAIALANARAAEARSYGILQVSGLEYRYRDAGAAGVQLLSVTVGGRPLEVDRVYTVAMPDYVSGMAATYLVGAELGPCREIGETLTAIVIGRVERDGGVVSRPAPGRMVKEP